MLLLKGGLFDHCFPKRGRPLLGTLYCGDWFDPIVFQKEAGHCLLHFPWCFISHCLEPIVCLAWQPQPLFPWCCSMETKYPMMLHSPLSRACWRLPVLENIRINLQSHLFHNDLPYQKRSLSGRIVEWVQHICRVLYASSTLLAIVWT